jgi:hypothetical protein
MHIPSLIESYPVQPASTDQTVSFRHAQEPDPPEIPFPEENAYSESQYTEIYVSARRLMQASPYFDRMLNGDWKESKTLQSNGSVTIVISDWDIGAIQILMGIIRGRPRKIPEL